MKPIEYVKGIYYKKEPDNKFKMEEDGYIEEKLDSENYIKTLMSITFPIYGEQFLDDKKRSLNIFFDNDKNYNASICSFVSTEEDCKDFIIFETLKKFWCDVIIPEDVLPDNYYEKFWDYNINIYIGNIVYYKKNEKNIAVLPYYIEFLL